MTTYRLLENEILKWAREDVRIQAVVCVGSRARPGVRQDDRSDLDLVVFTDQPDELIGDLRWLHNFGLVWLIVPHMTGAGDHELIVLYENACRVDLVLTRAAAGVNLSQMIAGSPYQEVFGRGYRPIYAGSNAAAPAPAYIPKYTLPRPKSAGGPGEISSTVDRLFLSAVSIVQLARRGELWRAQDMLATKLRPDLLSVFSWHARAHGLPETEPDGRRMATWLEPDIESQVSQLFPGWGMNDVLLAVRTAVNLADTLLGQLAEKSGLSYPSKGQGVTLDWIESNLTG